MAVPAHDTRDWDFAKAFDLPILQVVAAEGGEEVDVQKAAFTDVATGVMVNSGFMTGMTVEEAKKAMIEYLEKNGHRSMPRSTISCVTGCSPASVTGASPFPSCSAPSAAMCPCRRISCRCVLPEVESYETTDDGESPLSAMTRLGGDHLPLLRRPRRA